MIPPWLQIEAAIRAVGLEPRGGFHPRPADSVPLAAGGVPTATLVLVGNVGGSMWPVFTAAPEYGLAHDPLDRWTRRVVEGLARQLGATAVYPFGGPPHHPFLRWAQRAEPVTPSPLGLLIHPDHGLWHAYRAALLFADPILLPPRVERESPCLTCSGRPCLSSCPVSAFSASSHDVAACVRHAGGEQGSDCRDHGCLARRACPVGREQTYPQPQQTFHMARFLDSRFTPAARRRDEL